MSNDMVMFNMPNGTQVSNDPRFDLETALAEALNDGEDRGSNGPTWDEQQAQIAIEREAALNSGQPGVGANSVPDDIERDLHGPLGSDAQRTQVEDRQQAEDAGASPHETSVDDDEPIDGNARVTQVRESLAEDRQKYQAALEKLGEDGAGEGTDYSSWTGKQLKAEVARRNADEDRPEEERIQLTKGLKVADVAAMLEADDEAQANKGEPANGQSEEFEGSGDGDSDDSGDGNTEE